MEWFPNFRSNPAFESLLSGAHSAVGEMNTDADSENSESTVWTEGGTGDRSQGSSWHRLDGQVRS